MSLPLAPMFLGHLYVQLDILHNDEQQAGSCHIVTSFIPPYFSSGCLSVVLNIWRNVDLPGLPGRSTRVARERSPTSVAGLNLTFHLLLVGVV